MRKSIKVIGVIAICILIGGMGFILIHKFTGGNHGIGSPPVNPAVNVAFTDTDLDHLELGGTITITRAVNESDISHYVLYWGSGPSTKNGPAIVELNKTGSDLTYPIVQNTSLPVNTTHFLVYTKNVAGEMATGVNLPILDNATPTERLVNGGFESGPGVGWVQTEGSYTIIAHYTEPNCEVRTGQWSAWHGGVTDYSDAQYQVVTISPNATVATLKYYYFIETTEAMAGEYDFLYVKINSSTIASYSDDDDTASSWYLAIFDLTPYIGDIVVIWFQSYNDMSDNTNFFIDDVSLLADD